MTRKEILDKYGAREDYYKIGDTPSFYINGSFYMVSISIMPIEIFISKIINNQKHKFDIYIYDIKLASIIQANNNMYEIRWMDLPTINKSKSIGYKLQKIMSKINE